MEPKCKLTWSRNISVQRSLSSYETAPGPSSADSSSQVFPADAAVATVSKNNTFFWISTGRVNASTAYVEQGPGRLGVVVCHYPGPHKV